MVAKMAAVECAHGNSAWGGVKREGLHGWLRACTVRTESADILARSSAQASSAAHASCSSAEAAVAAAEVEVEAEAEDCTTPGKAVVKEWDK